MLKGSIAAMITPFTAEGNVDYEAFRKLIQWQLEEKTEGFVIAGTTGESPTLTDEEQEMLLQIALQEVKGRVPVLMGTGTNSTQTTLAKTMKAKQLGADGCLVIFPYYNKPNFEGCYEHLKRVSGVGLPVVLYHHPGRTGIKFSAEQLKEFANLTGVIGVKESSGDVELAADLMRISSTTVLAGDDGLSLPLIALGAKGVISVIANVLPRLWHEMIQSCLMGDFSQARSQMERLSPLCKALSLDTNPQCIKYAVSLVKRAEPHMRLPLIQPKETVKEKIAKALHNILWEKRPEAKNFAISALEATFSLADDPQRVERSQ